MSGLELVAKYRALAERGDQPRAVYAAALRDGVPKLDRLRIVCTLFRSSMADAKAVAESVEGPPRGALPDIIDRDGLERVLAAELGYCSCVGNDAINTLRDFLDLVRRRGEATANAVAFSEHSRALERFTDATLSNATVGHWFILGLEQRGSINHGLRVTDVWITDRGRKLLNALNQFQQPD